MIWHMATAEKMCSKCAKVAPEDGDVWCKECRKNYKREYDQNRAWRAERRGIIRGIRGMREYLSATFRNQPRPFQGPEAAALIDSLPGPAVADESAATE
jgi:hypothetical protein